MVEIELAEFLLVTSQRISCLNASTILVFLINQILIAEMMGLG